MFLSRLIVLFINLIRSRFILCWSWGIYMCRLYSHQRISFKMTTSYINVFHNENMISRLTWRAVLSYIPFWHSELAWPNFFFIHFFSRNKQDQSLMKTSPDLYKEFLIPTEYVLSFLVQIILVKIEMRNICVITLSKNN